MSRLARNKACKRKFEENQGATFYRRDFSFEVVIVPDLFMLSGSLPTLDQELYMSAVSTGIGFFISKGTFKWPTKQLVAEFFNFTPTGLKYLLTGTLSVPQHWVIEWRKRASQRSRSQTTWRRAQLLSPSLWFLCLRRSRGCERDSSAFDSSLVNNLTDIFQRVEITNQKMRGNRLFFFKGNHLLCICCCALVILAHLLRMVYNET